MLNITASRSLALLLPLALAAPSLAGVVAVGHTVNGFFDPFEWTLTPTPNPARPTVVSSSFNVGGPGGAVLYVEQSNNGIPAFNSLGHNLELMYDFVNSPSVIGGSPANSSFDVFFQLPNGTTSGDDYALHITSSSVTVFEKPSSIPSAEANGHLLLTDTGGNAVSPWTLLSPGDPDVILGDFHTAIGFGPSPNSPIPHLMAEFRLSVNTKGTGTADGLYSPEPAFWSASAKGDTDPPISSAIFELNPDGSILLSPVLGPNGGPVLQPQDALPEPTSILILALPAAALAARRRARPST